MSEGGGFGLIFFFFFLPMFPGIEPCAVGSTVEVLINPHHAARPDLLAVSFDYLNGLVVIVVCPTMWFTLSLYDSPSGLTHIPEYRIIKGLLVFKVTAFSPTNRPLGCPVSDDNGTFYASFNPDEAGEWRIHVTYDDEDIEHSPFRCMVFDPRAIFVSVSLF